jgi:menaquinol-cytochrome c reductase iron-sulfur subunit
VVADDEEGKDVSRRKKRKQAPRQLTLPGVASAANGTTIRRERVGPIKRARLVLVTTPTTRRRFLAGTLGWVSAGIAAALGIPAAVSIVSQGFRETDLGWSPVARLAKPEPGEPDITVVGEPVLTQFTSLVQDAYMKAAPREAAIYVVNRGEGDITVFDVRCTHLGCPVAWEKARGRFVSPCHNGLFDIDGRVTGGPPPRPLDQYEVKVENGVLFVGELYQVNDQLQRVTT